MANNGDQKSEIERVRAAIAQQLGLGVPILGREPVVVHKVEVLLLSSGEVRMNFSGDEIVTRFLFSKGMAIYEMSLEDELRRQVAMGRVADVPPIGSADCTPGDAA